MMASRRVAPLAFKSVHSFASLPTPSTSLAVSPCISPSSRTSRRPPAQRPRLFRLFSHTTTRPKEAPSSSSSSTTTPPPAQPDSKLYTYPDIADLSSHPSPSRILIDVREPSELQTTGTIPTSHNVPLKSSPDSFFLPAEEFEDKFGFERPGKDVEVIFFCKSGVRSQAAAQLARRGGFGGKVGEYQGSWMDWEGNGGKVEKVS